MLRNFLSRMFTTGLERELLEAFIKGDIIVVGYEVDEEYHDYEVHGPGGSYIPYNRFVVLARADSPDNPLLTVYYGKEAVFYHKPDTGSVIQRESEKPYRRLFMYCRRAILQTEKENEANLSKVISDRFSSVVRERMLKGK